MTRKTIATLTALAAIAATPTAAQAAARQTTATASASASRTMTTPQPRPTARPKTTSRIVAGSTGQAGWDDAACQGYADFWGSLVSSAEYQISQGDTKGADATLADAEAVLGQLESKCSVMF
jgi:hypothetical protein